MTFFAWQLEIFAVVCANSLWRTCWCNVPVVSNLTAARRTAVAMKISFTTEVALVSKAFPVLLPIMNVLRHQFSSWRIVLSLSTQRSAVLTDFTNIAFDFGWGATLMCLSEFGTSQGWLGMGTRIARHFWGVLSDQFSFGLVSRKAKEVTWSSLQWSEFKDQDFGDAKTDHNHIWKV